MIIHTGPTNMKAFHGINLTNKGLVHSMTQYESVLVPLKSRKSGLNSCLSSGVTLSEYRLPCPSTGYDGTLSKSSLSMLIYAGIQHKHYTR